MCLAVPGQVLTIVGEDLLARIGKVAFSGIVKEVNLAFLPETKIGDYVLVHAGFAISILDEAEAKRSLDYIQALSAFADKSEPRS